MTNDLGVWTAEDCALVLIDYQNEMFEVIRSETPADLAELHVRLLAKTARAFGLPIIASTVGVGFGFNGPTLHSIEAELDGVVHGLHGCVLHDSRFRRHMGSGTTARRVRRGRSHMTPG